MHLIHATRPLWNSRNVSQSAVLPRVLFSRFFSGRDGLQRINVALLCTRKDYSTGSHTPDARTRIVEGALGLNSSSVDAFVDCITGAKHGDPGKLVFPVRNEKKNLKKDGSQASHPRRAHDASPSVRSTSTKKQRLKRLREEYVVSLLQHPDNGAVVANVLAPLAALYRTVTVTAAESNSVVSASEEQQPLHSLARAALDDDMILPLTSLQLRHLHDNQASDNVQASGSASLVSSGETLFVHFFAATCMRRVVAAIRRRMGNANADDKEASLPCLMSARRILDTFINLIDGDSVKNHTSAQTSAYWRKEADALWTLELMITLAECDRATSAAGRHEARLNVSWESNLSRLLTNRLLPQLQTLASLEPEPVKGRSPTVSNLKRSTFLFSRVVALANTRGRGSRVASTGDLDAPSSEPPPRTAQVVATANMMTQLQLLVQHHRYPGTSSSRVHPRGDDDDLFILSTAATQLEDMWGLLRPPEDRRPGDEHAAHLTPYPKLNYALLHILQNRSKKLPVSLSSIFETPETWPSLDFVLSRLSQLLTTLRLKAVHSADSPFCLSASEKTLVNPSENLHPIIRLHFSLARVALEMETFASLTSLAHNSKLRWGLPKTPWRTATNTTPLDASVSSDTRRGSTALCSASDGSNSSPPPNMQASAIRTFAVVCLHLRAAATLYIRDVTLLLQRMTHEETKQQHKKPTHNHVKLFLSPLHHSFFPVMRRHYLFSLQTAQLYATETLPASLDDRSGDSQTATTTTYESLNEAVLQGYLETLLLVADALQSDAAAIGASHHPRPYSRTSAADHRFACGVPLHVALDVCFLLSREGRCTHHSRSTVHTPDRERRYLIATLRALELATTTELLLYRKRWGLVDFTGVRTHAFSGGKTASALDDTLCRDFAQSLLTVTFTHARRPSLLFMPLWQLQELGHVLATHRSLLFDDRDEASGEELDNSLAEPELTRSEKEDEEAYGLDPDEFNDGEGKSDEALTATRDAFPNPAASLLQYFAQREAFPRTILQSDDGEFDLSTVHGYFVSRLYVVSNALRNCRELLLSPTEPTDNDGASSGQRLRLSEKDRERMVSLTEKTGNRANLQRAWATAMARDLISRFPSLPGTAECIVSASSGVARVQERLEEVAFAASKAHLFFNVELFTRNRRAWEAEYHHALRNPSAAADIANATAETGTSKSSVGVQTDHMVTLCVHRSSPTEPIGFTAGPDCRLRSVSLRHDFSSAMGESQPETSANEEHGVPKSVPTPFARALEAANRARSSSLTSSCQPITSEDAVGARIVSVDGNEMNRILDLAKFTAGKTTFMMLLELPDQETTSSRMI